GTAPKSSESAEPTEPEESLAMTANDIAADALEPFYVLIAGCDTRDGTISEGKGGHGSDGHSRTDTMMLVRIDPVEHKIAIISVPRDTKTDLGGWTVKLNQAYDEGGMDEVVNQVELLTGVDVKYWFWTKMADFVPLIDGLGGVDVEVPIELTGSCMVNGNKYTLEPGLQHLDGEQTSVLVQQRKQYGSPMDASRQIQDRKVVEWCIRHVAEMNADDAEQSARLLLSHCETDMPADEFVAYVRSFAGHADELSIVSCSGPYDGDIDPETELWLAYRDEEMWRDIINAIEEGRDPTEILPVPDVWAG
ncbi:MAG: LCP family protein, partial [Eggerthellaceae bacterium]|nr:LCP family protein [Eggerthellaceae bacterium]